MAEGIFHRDLAARNVLVFIFDENDPLSTSVKVADFGLSVRAYSNTHMYGAEGECRPVRYMPPETLKKGRCEPWLVRVYLYHMMYARVCLYLYLACVLLSVCMYVCMDAESQHAHLTSADIGTQFGHSEEHHLNFYHDHISLGQA